MTPPPGPARPVIMIWGGEVICPAWDIRKCLEAFLVVATLVGKLRLAFNELISERFLDILPCSELLPVIRNRLTPVSLALRLKKPECDVDGFLTSVRRCGRA